jgi:hypothetical protein
VGYSIISYATFETIRAMVAELSPRGMAYLDPGSGSYLLQLLIAGFLGGLFVIRASWDKIKAFFRKLFDKQANRGLDDE